MLINSLENVMTLQLNFESYNPTAVGQNDISWPNDINWEVFQTRQISAVTLFINQIWMYILFLSVN